MLALVAHSLHAHRPRGIKRALTGCCLQDALLREYIFVIMSGATGSSARKRPRSLSTDDVSLRAMGCSKCQLHGLLGALRQASTSSWTSSFSSVLVRAPMTHNKVHSNNRRARPLVFSTPMS